MKRDVKIFLIINIVLILILVPSLIYYFYYYQYQKNQTQSTQRNLLLLPFLWTVKIGGSAVNSSRTFTIQEFDRHSNVTKAFVYKTSTGESTHAYKGFSLKHLVYDIMNVSTYSEVSIKAQDGWAISYPKADIDTWNEEILLVYLEDGLPILKKELGGEGPVRTITSQAYCIFKFGDDYNGRLCAKYVISVEINI